MLKVSGQHDLKEPEWIIWPLVPLFYQLLPGGYSKSYLSLKYDLKNIRWLDLYTQN